MLTGVNENIKGAVLKWFNEGLKVKEGDPVGPRAFVTYIHDLVVRSTGMCVSYIRAVANVLHFSSINRNQFQHVQKQLDALDV